MPIDTAVRGFDLDSAGKTIAGFPWLRVVATGAVGFLVGYLLLIAVLLLGPGSTNGSFVDVLVFLAFVLYSAHSVPAVVRDAGELDYLQYLAQPATPDPATPVLVYYAVPIVAMVAAGGFAAYRYGDESGRPRDALLTGVGAAVGYGAVAVAGALALGTRPVFGGPSELKVEAAATFGLAYPLVFATVAAIAVQFVRYVRTIRQA